MADVAVPHFCNDRGVEKIHIGVKEFQCMGASPPHDHPHVFLDMGQDRQVICPYCSTLYLLSDTLHAGATEPPGCAYREPVGAGAAGPAGRRR